MIHKTYTLPIFFDKGVSWVIKKAEEKPVVKFFVVWILMNMIFPVWTLKEYRFDKEEKGNIVDNENEGNGNTESDSEQAVFSKTDDNRILKNDNQTEIGDKSSVKKTSIKQIEFDKKN